MDNPQSHSQPANNEVSLKEVILFLKEWFHYLLSQWKILTIALAAGLLLGTAYSFFSPTKYVAKTTFVLDEDSQNGTLAALTGISTVLGSNTTGQGSLFSADNIVWLYSSDRMLEETLLAVVDNNGQKISLINWLLAENKDLKAIDLTVRDSDSGYKGFPQQQLKREELSIAQSKILKAAAQSITKNYLSVGTEDNTSGVIGVSLISKDQLFSYYFVNELVRRVNYFYIDTKTQKEKAQVAVLQKKVDVFNKRMDTSMHQAASASDAIPNANPMLRSLQVTPQRKIVDVQVNSTIYSSMVQQLEMAKLTLDRETPLIQVVDSPLLPLPTINKSLTYCIFFGAFLCLFLGISFVVLRRLYFKALRNE